MVIIKCIRRHLHHSKQYRLTPTHVHTQMIENSLSPSPPPFLSPSPPPFLSPFHPLTQYNNVMACEHEWIINTFGTLHDGQWMLFPSRPAEHISLDPLCLPWKEEQRNKRSPRKINCSEDGLFYRGKAVGRGATVQSRQAGRQVGEQAGGRQYTREKLEWYIHTSHPTNNRE